MRVVDISLSLDPSTPVYPGDPAVAVERLSEALGGDRYALSRLTIGSHAGTHVDAPAHFIAGGATVDALPLEACIGAAVVLDVAPSGDTIDIDQLAGLPEGATRVLLRTGGPPIGGCALGVEAARALVRRGVRLVGIDALSVAPPGAPGAVHHILLAAGVVILEGLDLSRAA